MEYKAFDLVIIDGYGIPRRTVECYAEKDVELFDIAFEEGALALALDWLVANEMNTVNYTVEIENTFDTEFESETEYIGNGVFC